MNSQGPYAHKVPVNDNDDDGDGLRAVRGISRGVGIGIVAWILVGIIIWSLF